MLTRFASWLAGGSRRDRRAARRACRRDETLNVERLEPREVMDATPVGPEFLVNSTTSGRQEVGVYVRQSVAMSENGEFVVVWASESQELGAGVYAQRFDATGEKIGGEFRVNQYTTNDQLLASVAMDADGDFVVAWQSEGQDGNDYGIYARRFDSTGTALGDEFLVNTYTTGEQSWASVAMNDEGDFIVTWRSEGQDGDNWGVYGQRYNAAGGQVGGEFHIGSHTTGEQRNARAAMDSDGNFVVVWDSYGHDGDDWGVFGQRYDFNGDTIGDEFLVGSMTTGTQYSPKVAMDAAGRFVVAWMDERNTSIGLAAWARLFNADGTPFGSDFQVSLADDPSLHASSVWMDDAGNFVVAWEDQGEPDGSAYGTYARAYSAAGLPLGPEFLVNTHTENQQGNPSVAIDSHGNMVAVWSSFQQDGNNSGVYAQRYKIQYSNDIALSNDSIVEGSAVDAAVGVVVGSLNDPAGPLTFSLQSDPSGFFVLVGNVLRTTAVLDYEAGHSYDVTIRVSDGVNFYDEVFTINVTNVAPTAPTDADAEPNIVYTNAGAGTVVGVKASASDVAGGTVTYALANDAGGRFAIDAATGVVTVKAGAPALVHGTNYTILVTASDGTADSTASEFTIAAVALPTIVTGTEGKDSIKIVYKNGAYVMKMNGASSTLDYMPGGAIFIYGLGGNDKITIDKSALASFYIDGGDGNDKITGGSGDDVLISGLGNDSLRGGRGRDLLIGGLGKDKVRGGGSGTTTAADADILIGDATAHDADQDALLAIAAAWQANDSATVRSYLDTTTVEEDGQRDSVKSATKKVNDWLFSFELNSKGKLVDLISRQTGDVLN